MEIKNIMEYPAKYLGRFPDIARIPIAMRNPRSSQSIIKGKIRFLTEEGEFIVTEGDSYIFDSEEKHGAFILEQGEVIEVFNPAKDNYV